MRSLMLLTLFLTSFQSNAYGSSQNKSTGSTAQSMTIKVSFSLLTTTEFNYTTMEATTISASSSELTSSELAKTSFTTADGTSSSQWTNRTARTTANARKEYKRLPHPMKMDKSSFAMAQKFNVHVSKCYRKNSTFIETIMSSVIIRNNKTAIWRGSSTNLIHRCFNASYNFSKYQLDSNGGPQKYTTNGRCRPSHQAEPYESFNCHCEPGFYGIHCQGESDTKPWLPWIFIAVVLVEAIFIGYAIFAALKTRSPEGHKTARRRFLEVLTDE